MKRIWKRSRAWLPLLTLSGLLCAPQMTPSAQAGLFSMSEQDEIAAGQEVAAIQIDLLIGDFRAAEVGWFLDQHSSVLIGRRRTRSGYRRLAL